MGPGCTRGQVKEGRCAGQDAHSVLARREPGECSWGGGGTQVSEGTPLDQMPHKRAHESGAAGKPSVVQGTAPHMLSDSCKEQHPTWN